MAESTSDGALPGAAEPEDALSLAARRAAACAVQCTPCADAGVPDVMSLPEHLRGGPAIAELCEATAWLAARRTGSNQAVLKEMLEACAAACDRRAEFCERFDHPHCRQGAEASRDCARDCRAALESV